MGQDKYYDHSLIEMEKGKLIDELARNPKSFTTTGDAPVQSSALSVGKDKRSLSLLQVGEVPKVVDENGEPLVVYHGTPLSRSQIPPNRGWHGEGMTLLYHSSVALKRTEQTQTSGSPPPPTG